MGVIKNAEEFIRFSESAVYSVQHIFFEIKRLCFLFSKDFSYFFTDAFHRAHPLLFPAYCFSASQNF